LIQNISIFDDKNLITIYLTIILQQLTPLFKMLIMSFLRAFKRLQTKTNVY